MEIVILLITIYVFIKTLIYGIIEIKQEHNIYGGSATILIGVLALNFYFISYFINLFRIFSY